MMREPSFAATALRMSSGVIVWALHFTTIYGFTGWACSRVSDASGRDAIAAVPWVIAIATAIAAALILVTVAQAARNWRSDFTSWMTACVAALALSAVLLEGAAVLWVPACD
jgi:hypothetical protein